jgi:ABC-type multidrug transport system fused ATPase/permease subunit
MKLFCVLFESLTASQAIITFATESYTANKLGQPAPHIGKGIGMSFGLLGLQLLSSICQHHFFYRSGGTGVLLRAGLIAAVYDRSLQLSARARSTLTNGKLINHISTDVSRIDFAAGFFHMAWTAPIQMIICLILLIINIGPSALAGFALFIILTPLQGILISKLFKLRRVSMTWTDKRAKLLQELLTGIKVIKFFAWEVPYLDRIYGLRDKELT